MSSARLWCARIPHVFARNQTYKIALVLLFCHLQEAYHIQTFGDFLDRRGFRGVATCPFVYRQFSSKR